MLLSCPLKLLVLPIGIHSKQQFHIIPSKSGLPAGPCPPTMLLLLLVLLPFAPFQADLGLVDYGLPSAEIGRALETTTVRAPDCSFTSWFVSNSIWVRAPAEIAPSLLDSFPTPFDFCILALDWERWAPLIPSDATTFFQLECLYVPTSSHQLGTGVTLRCVHWMLSVWLGLLGIRPLGHQVWCYHSLLSSGRPMYEYVLVLCGIRQSTSEVDNKMQYHIHIIVYCTREKYSWPFCHGHMNVGSSCAVLCVNKS
jgi:hypothetical protein